MQKSSSSSSRVAAHVRDLPRSGIRDFFEVVQSMREVISLGIGEPDFVTPWHIREAAIYALEKGRTGYTSNLGAPKLRRAVSRYVHENHGMSYDPASEVIITVGVSEAIDLALRAILNPGDEVIYHEPCYVAYNPSIALAHARPVRVPTFVEHGFALRAEDLERVVTPRTRVVMLNFPTNPTGAVLRGEELARVAEVCVKHDLLVLSDEVYGELTYDQKHQSIVNLPGMRERTIFLHGMSKAWAMTGFRLGFACAPADLIEAMMKVHQYSMLCASIISQEAAVEALEHGAESVARMRESYARRREWITSALNQIGLPCVKPQGAFYAFPDIRPTGLSSREFSLRLLEEEKVAVVPGTAFGSVGEGFVRCSFATGLDQIEIAMERMKQFVSRCPGQ